MATATLSSAEKDIGGEVARTPSSSGSSSEGSDFVIIAPPDGGLLGSPNDFQVNALATPFANGGTEVSTMMNADHLMTAFNGLKQENGMLKGQLTEMNKAMQSRIVEIQTIRDDQNRMTQDLKDKHQKAKKAIAHHLEQNKNLSERLKDLIEKDNQSTRKVESLQKEISQLQMELRKSQALALSRAPPTSNSDAPSSAPSSLLTQMQEDLKNAQETRADFKRELQQMEEAGRQSEEALHKANETELQRLQRAVKRNDVEKQDLLKINQELQQNLDNMQQKAVAGSLHADDPRPQNSQSSQSGQSEGEFIEEEQGYSLMQDSKDFTGKQGFGEDILKQLQNERERCDKVSAELKEEHANAMELKARVTKLEADLQTANHQLMETSATYEKEVSEMDEKHKAEVDDLVRKIDDLAVKSQSSQEERFDSGAQLKHQVKSLVAELNTKEQDIKDRDQTIDNLHAEVAALRTKLSMYHDDLEKEREQSTQLIETLRGEIHRQNGAIQAFGGEAQQRDTMLKAEKQKALHAQLELDRLKEEYDQLFGDYDNLTRNFESMRSTCERQKQSYEKVQPMVAKHREMMESHDGLVARLISAEEAIKAKDEQNQQLREEMKQLKSDLDTIPVLRAQAEVYKADFDAERAAREKAHADKEVLLNELETLKAENEQVQQEAANQAQPRVLEMQRRHGGDAQPGHDEFGMHLGSADQWGTFQPYGDNNIGDLYIHQPQGQPGANREGNQADRNVTCPKCMEQFPDMDTLQIHMLECIQ